ncbi:MAG TPA: ATP-binding cassette domain-containing protein [Candidatus Acidoferrum sp.]|nr:ATP-binding cassette domain-containing protein [Candidatus Acidoferrum sp.]
MIRLENISYRYGPDSEPILRDLTLAIRTGEWLCLMGANGCGKTTLARIIAGLSKATGGEVKFDCPNAEGPAVGILFQNPDNQMVATVVDKEIAFSLENQGVCQEEMERRIGSTLDRFRIGHLRSRLTTELSGGEKQRVALASVMVGYPPVLILDEPDSFLDESGKQILSEELRRLHHEQPELVEIRITQYPQVARTYSRLVVIHEGKVAADGSPDSILSDRAFCLRTGLRFDLENRSELAVPAITAQRAKQTGVLPYAIKLAGIDFEYASGTPVLKNAGLKLKRGETVGLVGASGCGKSTLGLIMCGLLKPKVGELRFENENGLHIAKQDGRGWVVGLFQQPERQFFLPTCSEEVAFGPANLEMPLPERDIGAFMQMVGLDVNKFGQRDPFSLSMGEKRRLAFASVLSMAPLFVVFDEPTCGLDQDGVGRFVLLSQALKRHNVGQVLISHDGDVINTLADRVLYLKNKSQLEELSTRQLFESNQYAGVVSPRTW